MERTIPKITLRAARVNAGLSQKEAANRLRINVRTLQKYENHIVVPQWDKIKAMEQLYNMNSDFFFLESKFAKSGKNTLNNIEQQ